MIAERPTDVSPPKASARVMRILVAGAGGMIGSALAPALAKEGHTIARLVRRNVTSGAAEVRWDPDGGAIDLAGVEGFDVVVHVASLPQARWTAAYKRRWRANHVGANRLLSNALAGCRRKPGLLICASAQGIYAPAGDAALTEASPTGAGWLAEMLRAGEATAAPASAAGIRVVHLRFPTVLGGRALTGFGSGISRLGSGRQWFSWVARDELPGIVGHIIATETLEGPVNAVSPYPARNAAFFATLGRALGRPPRRPIPAWLLRLMIGEMADALILAGRRIEPRQLLATGYRFRFPDLEGALRHELGVMGGSA